MDELLAEEKFNMTGGLPQPLRFEGDPRPIMEEAVRYHLAELDWRDRSGLRPADATPLHGYEQIDAERVAPERLATVIAEVQRLPSFMYHAGGEATYAIAWSARENAFVRIHACC